MKGHPLLYATPARPGETYTAAQLRELAGRANLNVTQYVKNGTPIHGDVYTVCGTVADAPKEFGKVTKPIVCHCPECRSKPWTLDQIRALPGVGGAIHGTRLPLINRATDHAFAYAPQTAAGTWHKAGPAGEPAKVEGRRHVYGSESTEMPVNPKWLDLTFISGGEGGGRP